MLIENGIPAGKIQVIPEPLTRRFELTVKDDPVFRIIVVGTVSLRKGAQYVLEAASRLKLPNSEVVLIGPVMDEFQPVLKRYKGHFVLAGPVSETELARHYRGPGFGPRLGGRWLGARDSRSHVMWLARNRVGQYRKR